MCFKSQCSGRETLFICSCCELLAVRRLLNITRSCDINPEEEAQCQTTKPETCPPADRLGKFFIPMFLFLKKLAKKIQLWWKRDTRKGTAFLPKHTPILPPSHGVKWDNRWVSACGSLKGPKNSLLSPLIYQQTLFCLFFPHIYTPRVGLCVRQKKPVFEDIFAFY